MCQGIWLNLQDAPTKTHPGEVVEIESEEELDKILQEDKDSLIVLLGSLTWCRPCKTLAKPLQVRCAHLMQSPSRFQADLSGQLDVQCCWRAEHNGSCTFQWACDQLGRPMPCSHSGRQASWTPCASCVSAVNAATLPEHICSRALWRACRA